VRQLRAAVDLATAVLSQAPLTRDDAERIVAATRQRSLALFPEGGRTFELVLAPRFRRIIEERFGRRPGAEIVPFPGPRGI